METELKFLLSREAARRLEAEWLEGGRTKELVSTYFDTPGRDLQRAGASLRLRRRDEGWVQTLKAGASGAVERIEEERPVAEGTLEPDLFPPPVLDALVGGSASDLRPVFETRVTRRSLDIDQGAARIEAALDEGRIQAGGADAPILELELELKSGDLAALFAAGRRVLGVPGTSLSLTSKAERGYRLADLRSATATKFTPPPLDLRGDAAAGFQALALAALHQLIANVELLQETPTPEAVHQARVALRRLKTFVTAFKDLVSDDRASQVRTALNRMIAIFEEARALDVFQSEAFVPLARPEPGSALFGHALLKARSRAYGDVQETIRDAAFARDVFDLVEWTLCGPWLAAVALRPEGGERLDETARRILAHRWKVMQRRGRELDWSDPYARHKLRIQGKKMRYLIESVGDPRAAEGWLDGLKSLQDQLGVLNDIATAAATARLAYTHASPEAVFSAGVVVGERRAEQAGRMKAARRAFKRLVSEFGHCKTPARLRRR